MRSLLLTPLLVAAVSCGGTDTKDNNNNAPTPDPRRIEGEKLEEAYEAWQKQKLEDYSYSWVFATTPATVVSVNVVGGVPVCRSMVVRDTVEWSENVDTMNTHDGIKATTLDTVYTRCWGLYQKPENKDKINLFFKGDYLVGCHLGCAADACKDEEVPFFRLETTNKLCKP